MRFISRAIARRRWCSFRASTDCRITKPKTPCPKTSRVARTCCSMRCSRARASRPPWMRNKGVSMKTFFHPEQLLHHPSTYFSRGQMRKPQEVPERAARLVAAVQSMDFDVVEPKDHGTAAIAAVHDMNYVR